MRNACSRVHTGVEATRWHADKLTNDDVDLEGTLPISFTRAHETFIDPYVQEIIEIP